MTNSSKPTKRKLDAFGAFAYSLYILVGGFFAFGFAYALEGAVEVQEAAVCKVLRPEFRSRIRGTLLVDGKPAERYGVNPGLDGTAETTTDETGAFTLLVPEGTSSVRFADLSGTSAVAELLVGPTRDIEAKFEMSGETATATIVSDERFMAPEIEAQDLNGNPVKLSDFRGKFVVVNFWATWCEPCTTEWPQLHQLAARMAERDDVVVLAVTIDSEQEKILPFLELMSLMETEVAVVWDPTSEVHTQYGSSKIPDTFFVNEEGELVSAFVNVRKWGAPEAFHCVDGSIGR